MSMFGSQMGFAKRVLPPSYIWTTGPASGTNASTYTFSALDFSTAGNRWVVVGIMSIGAALGVTNLTSVTIGGITATLSNGIVATNGDRVVSAIAIAYVPTGATGDVVVVFDQTMARCAISVWAAYNLTSITKAQSTSSTAGPAALSINTVTGDLLFSVAYSNGGGSATWSGITERFDTTVEGALVTGADTTALTTSSPLAATCAYSLSDAERVGVIASFR